MGAEGAPGQSITSQGFVDQAHPRAAEDQPLPELPVSGVRQLGIEPSGVNPDAPPNRAHAEDEVPVQDGGSLVCGREGPPRVVRASHRLAVSLHDRIGDEDVEVGMPRGEPGQRLQPPGQEDVVGVQHHHVVTPGLPDGDGSSRPTPRGCPGGSP